jgi:SAM-dependent methyltransferase
MENTTATDSAIPLVITASNRMGALRDALATIGYYAQSVCERLGLNSIFEYESIPAERAAPSSIDDALDALIHLFLAGRPLPRVTLESLLWTEVPGLLEEHGLIAGDTEDPTLVVPTVMFYPVDELLIASDLARNPPLPDAVYPAIAANTGELLALMPNDACDAFLDLCSGTAVAALVAGRRSDWFNSPDRPGQAWAVDVTERATRFAAFNAALNGIANVTVLRGDVWAPVAGLTFDRIVAHPPYVPTVESELIYRAGGEDGEHVTRRIIEGLPDHLRAGGRFLCSCMLSDRTDWPVERRLRVMLGQTNTGFDVYVLAKAVSTPEQYFSSHETGEDAPTADSGLVDRLRDLGVERLVLCTIAIDRHDEDRPGLTARRQVGDMTGLAELDWLVEWERSAADPDLPAKLIASKPRISPAVRLELLSRPADGTWVPERCRLLTEWPFRRVIEVPVTIAEFLVGCDGSRTITEHRARALEAGLVPADMSAEGFASSLLPLIGSGILVFEDAEASEASEASRT